MGFTVAEIPREGVETMISSAMLDSYIAMKVTTEIAEKLGQFESEQAGILTNSIEKIEGDGMTRIRETISLIESLLPSQTAEVRKLFLSIEDEKEFIELFMKSYGGSKKKFALSWEDEPSSKTRPLFAGIVYYRRVVENITENPMMSFQDKQKLKQEIDKSLRHAAQLSASEKFVAWASLQSKKRQEATHQAEEEGSQGGDPTQEEEGQTPQPREEG